MHNMGLKWPIFISYVISVMEECFFAESLKVIFYFFVKYRAVYLSFRGKKQQHMFKV